MENNIKKDPIYKARELGIAIIESREYTNLKKAEKEYSNDQEASSLMDLYDEHMAIYNNLITLKEKDLDKERETINKVNEIKNKIDSNPILENLYKCQKEYDTLIKKINEVIDYMTGKNSNNKSKCENCTGCSKH